jgi:hypothetical protein
MNIAIIISGRIDLFEQSVMENYNNIINPLIYNGHTVNIFMSIWNHRDQDMLLRAYQPYVKVFDTETFTDYTSGLIKDMVPYETLVKLFGHSVENKVSNTLYWMYKLKRAYKFVKEYERVNNIEHDLYIRLRPDVTCCDPIDIHQLTTLNDSSIIVHVDHILVKDDKFYGCGEGWIDDNLCIAKQRPFETFCNTYDDIINLCLMTGSCISHILLKKQFELNNIKTIKPNSPLIIYRKGDDNNPILKFYHFEYCY